MLNFKNRGPCPAKLNNSGTWTRHIFGQKWTVQKNPGLSLYAPKLYSSKLEVLTLLKPGKTQENQTCMAKLHLNSGAFLYN